MDPLTGGLGGLGGDGVSAGGSSGSGASGVLGRVAAMFQEATQTQLQANEVTTRLQTMKTIAAIRPQ
jgi:ABC-type histidine transport system ATPase subunit